MELIIRKNKAKNSLQQKSKCQANKIRNTRKNIKINKSKSLIKAWIKNNKK